MRNTKFAPLDIRDSLEEFPGGQRSFYYAGSNTYWDSHCIGERTCHRYSGNFVYLGWTFDWTYPCQFGLECHWRNRSWDHPAGGPRNRRQPSMAYFTWYTD